MRVEGGGWSDSDINGENRGRKMEMREVSWACEVKGRESRRDAARGSEGRTRTLVQSSMTCL